MIIPIGHEDMRGRRWPYVTVGIIVLNVLVFLLSQGPIERGHQEYGEHLKAAFMYYMHHAYLKPSPPLEALVKQVNQNRHDRLLIESMSAITESARDATGGGTPENVAAEQAELDRLCAEAREAEQKSFVHKYGYVPANNNTIALISAQFLHAGWLHLIGNMLFLWLSGCNIEDRWGRVIFPLFYLSSGVAAALAQKVASPHSVIPMVGASGAIAGCMGAFLIGFARTRIRFMWFLFLRPRFFSAPAYLMLPIWLAVQLFWGMTFSSMNVEGGVAFWAHVGGFVFGSAFALVLRYSGHEAKLNQKIEGQISLEQAPEILHAQELIDQGQHVEAITVLEAFALQHQTNIDAQLVLLRAARAAQDGVRECRAYNRLIGLYLLQNAPETALDLYKECSGMGLGGQISAALRLKLARQMERAGDADAAGIEYSAIYGATSDVTAFQALLAHAQLCLKQGKKAEAIELFSFAQESPIPHLDSEANIAYGLKQAQALPDSQTFGAST